MSIFHGRPASLPDSPYIFADKSYFCIEDFRQIPTFADRPFVAGYPHMVSYLEIPLFAMSGHILGSYCVVDNKERDFLHPESLSTLREVTSAISSYLDMRRGEAGKSRSARMMQGLRRFVASGWRDRHDSVPKSVVPKLPKAHTDPFDLDVFNATTQRGIGSTPTGNAKTSDTTTRIVGSVPTRPPSIQEMSSITSFPQDADSKAARSDLSTQIKGLFVRAAHNIGNAMELDGLVFFDTVSSGKHGAGQSADMGTDETLSSRNDSFATPLSCYQRDVAVSQQSSLKLFQSLIRRLTARYTRGHLFTVDEHGVLQHGDDDDSNCDFDSLEDNEWTDLFTSLPKTRYLIFLPMVSSIYPKCI
jgi:hypothetical protein